LTAPPVFITLILIETRLVWFDKFAKRLWFCKNTFNKEKRCEKLVFFVYV
jgi:hypothetical protein